MITIGNIEHTETQYIIEVRDKTQAIKAQIVMPDNAIHHKLLMKENYIQFSFNFDALVSFLRGDYINYEGTKYILRTDCIFEEINTQNFKYNLKFEAEEMLLQDAQMYYLRQNLKESNWSLTSDAASFVKIAVDNANRYFESDIWKVGTIEATDIKLINFDNITIFDALTTIAETFDLEWYITNNTIHLIEKLSFGSEIIFENEQSITSLTRSEGEGNKPYNRIIALGSTKNIPSNYRQTAAGESLEATYQSRLRIPEEKGDIIDATSDLSPEEIIEGTIIFDDIYPKRIGVMSSISSQEYTETDEKTGNVTKWNAYRYKDIGLTFKEEYLLPNQELRIIFQSGKLNGLDFAIKFNPDNKPETSPESQIFEIIKSENYGASLPNEILKPENGDQYIIHGFNIQLIAEQYIPEAEKELYEKAKEWLQNNLKDKSVYECTSVINYFSDNNMDLEIGQNIMLRNNMFKEGFRNSRIMGFEKKLYNRFDCKYTVGDNPAYSRLAEIDKKIDEIKYADLVYEKTGLGNVYLIKQFDTTTPTDFNTYSAKASNAKYFNKQTGDNVQGDTLFQKNLQVQGSTLSDVFQNSTFTAGQLGSGFQMKRDANGQSYMEIDNLLVRREAVFNRLTIAEIKSVGGTILLSLANMTLSKVEDKASTWKCFFDTADGTIPNDFAVNDQVICRKFTGKNIKYYWALVTAVGRDYIEISKIDKDGSGIPAVGDEVVQLGNRKDVNRQYAIMLSAYGSDAPSIKQYSGINSYDLIGKEKTVISPSGNKFTGSFTVSTNGTTTPIYKETGLFVNGKTYYLNDRVSHLGSYWVCIVNSTIQTPNESSSAWRKETTGTSDINNAIDNIEIGGRNYIPSVKYTNLNYWDYAAKQWNIPALSNVVQLVNALVVPEDGTYTIQAKIKKTAIAAGVRVVVNGISATYLGRGQSSNGDFKLFTYIWSLKKGNIIELQAYTHDFQNLQENISVKEVKLEKGNKATAWSPAPEDVQAEINQAQKEAEKVRSENKADFVVLDTKIASKVSQIDFYSLQGRVSDTESSITQQSGQIQATVEKVEKKNAAYKSYTSAVTDRPSIPYAKGDLWITYDGRILQAANTRTSGAFIQSDWIETVPSANDIQIGGSNLLNNTSLLDNAAGWINKDGVTITKEQTLNDNYSAKFSFSGLTANRNSHIQQVVDLSKLEKGEQYTYSFYIYTPNASTIDKGIEFGLVMMKPSGTDWNMANYTLQSGKWIRIVKTFSIPNDITSAIFRMHLVRNGTVYYSSPQLEKANKESDWSPATQDINAGISNAQSTADSKNRTFYSNAQPATPSGGFKGGDLWYKINTVDGCYETYRWSGSAWAQINVSVSKATQTITNSSITNLVEKTGINALGNGQTLNSKIDQTADKITLEVNSIQIGGSNLLNNTSLLDNAAGWINKDGVTITKEQTLNDNYSAKFNFYGLTANRNSHIQQLVDLSKLEKGEQYTYSLYIYTPNASTIDKGVEFGLVMMKPSGTDWNMANYTLQSGKWIRIVKTFSIPNDITSAIFRMHLVRNGTVYYSSPQLEKGNKATDWSPATEDIPNIVGSALTLTDNKISLASGKIELDGDTIAKSIMAGDLKVGDRNKVGAALEVLKDGTFYAKGSNDLGASLTINSKEQSIEIISPYSANGSGSKTKDISTISISSDSGGIITTSRSGTTIASTNGLFANKAGQVVYPPSLGISSRGAVVGLGYGNLSKDNNLDFLAGVVGTAYNSNTINPAPAYGGWFDKLKANGLYLAVKHVSTSTTLSQTDCYVSCYNSASIIVNLPPSPYTGQVIYLRQMNQSSFNIDGNGISIHTDGTLVSTTKNRAGRGDTTMLVYDGKCWCLNYMAR